MIVILKICDRKGKLQHTMEKDLPVARLSDAAQKLQRTVVVWQERYYTHVYHTNAKEFYFREAEQLCV